MQKKSLHTIEKETQEMAWDEQKRLRMELKMSRDLNKLASEIEAIGIIAIAFCPDGEYCHQLQSSCGLLPDTFGNIYRRLADVHDRLEESGDHFDPESKGRAWSIKSTSED